MSRSVSLLGARSDDTLVSLVGLIYLASMAGHDWLLVTVLGLPPPITPEYLASHGTRHAIASAAVSLPAFGLLCAIWVARPGGTFEACLRAEGRGVVGATVAVTVLLTVVLDSAGAWPLTWRSPSSEAPIYAASLLVGRQWLALIVWAFALVAVTPLVEEAVFRFGMLTLVRTRTGSRLASTLITSVLFGVSHIGRWPPENAHTTHAIWLTIASIVLAEVTHRRGGRIRVSIAAHASANAVELASLLVTIWRLRQ